MKQILRTILIMMVTVSSTYGGDFLMLSELGTSAKSIGIANVQGFDHSANAIFENPASLTYSKLTSISLFNTKLIDELNVVALSASTKMFNGTVGVGWLMGTVEGIYQTGNSDSNVFYDNYEFGYKDNTLKLSYAMPFGEYGSFGFTVSTYQKNIDTYSGSGMGYELGYYHTFPMLEVSVLLRNLNETSIKYSNGQSETLPQQIVISGFLPFEECEVYMQTKLQSRKSTLFSGGVTYALPMVSALEVSLGFKQFNVLDAVNSGFTLGLGFDMDPIVLSYAYENGNFVENSAKHYFSLSTSLDFTALQKFEILGIVSTSTNEESASPQMQSSATDVQ